MPTGKIIGLITDGFNEGVAKRTKREDAERGEMRELEDTQGNPWSPDKLR